jgi:hypothetical protein
VNSFSPTATTLKIKMQNAQKSLIIIQGSIPTPHNSCFWQQQYPTARDRRGAWGGQKVNGYEKRELKVTEIKSTANVTYGLLCCRQYMPSIPSKQPATHADRKLSYKKVFN